MAAGTSSAAVTVTAYCLWAFERAVELGIRATSSLFLGPSSPIVPFTIALLHVPPASSTWASGAAPKELALRGPSAPRSTALSGVALFAIGVYAVTPAHPGACSVVEHPAGWGRTAPTWPRCWVRSIRPWWPRPWPGPSVPTGRRRGASSPAAWAAPTATPPRTPAAGGDTTGSTASTAGPGRWRGPVAAGVSLHWLMDLGPPRLVRPGHPRHPPGHRGRGHRRRHPREEPPRRRQLRPPRRRDGAGTPTGTHGVTRGRTRTSSGPPPGGWA